MTAQSLVLAPPASIGRLRVSATAPSSGERLALATTAIAVAFLPLLAPQGPSGTAPADGLIALAIGATALWAGRSGKRLRFAYGLPDGALHRRRRARRDGRPGARAWA